MTISTQVTSTDATAGGPVPVVARRHRGKPPAGWGLGIAMVIAALALLAVIVPFAAAYRVHAAAGQRSTAPSDVIVVLGAAQFDGTPSPVFRNRLDHARSLYESGVGKRIITVGGNQPGDRFTEAGSGRDYLIGLGVPPADIVAVDQGNDTLQSMTGVAEKMAAEGWRSATIVSDPVHLARSQAIAARLGIDARGNGTTSGDGSAITPEYLARETVGYLYFEGIQEWSVPRLVAAAQD